MYEAQPMQQREAQGAPRQRRRNRPRVVFFHKKTALVAERGRDGLSVVLAFSSKNSDGEKFDFRAPAAIPFKLNMVEVGTLISALLKPGRGAFRFYHQRGDAIRRLAGQWRENDFILEVTEEVKTGGGRRIVFAMEEGEITIMRTFLLKMIEQAIYSGWRRRRPTASPPVSANGSNNDVVVEEISVESDEDLPAIL